MKRFHNELLRKLRLEWGWTQETLAAELRIDVRTYRSYERGDVNRRSPDFEITRKDRYNLIMRMVEVLELSGPDDLLVAGDQHSDSPALATGSTACPPGTSFNQELYVPRQRAERTAAAYLARPGKPLIVWGPELSGKTWFLVHVARRWTETCQAKPPALVCIDLYQLEPDALNDEAQFLTEFGSAFIIGLDAPAALLKKSKEREGGNAARLTWLVKSTLEWADTEVLMIIDHADVLMASGWRDNFFAMLRGWASKNAEPWPRLRIGIGLAAAPALLTESIYSSPFHGLSEPLELDEFELPQVERLAMQYKLNWTESDLRSLVDFVGGHPYLLRAAMFEAALHETPLARLIESPETVPLLARHLRHMRTILARRPELWHAFRRVAQEPSAVLESGHYEALRRAGLLCKSAQGESRLRCRLYDRLS